MSPTPKAQKGTPKTPVSVKSNVIYLSLIHIAMLVFSLFFAGIVLNTLECKRLHHREELRLKKFHLLLKVLHCLLLLSCSCISLIAQKRRRIQIQTLILFWWSQSQHGSATDWCLRESSTLGQSTVSSEEVETGSSSALCIYLLFGLVGGEGGVARIGDGRGAGWPISIIQHLDWQQLVERPRGLVPPTEHIGE